VDVTKSASGEHVPEGASNYSTPWRSLNLIGNPYMSYLDFDAFVAHTGNSGIIDPVYATRDDDNKEYIYYTPDASSNPDFTASQYIHPHQGFFVKVKDEKSPSTYTLRFTNTMRVAGDQSTASPFRNHVNYPLINLVCYDSQGKRDVTTIEVGRPEAGGGSKMLNLVNGDALIYTHYDNRDYQTAFIPEGVLEVPVRFEAVEDGHFTMRWGTLHGDFSYLHLIDNMTGANVDCLATEEYAFEGGTDDYKSRFKLVFQYTGVDENDSNSHGSSFAFAMGDELIVEGEGTLQLFDVSGRCLMATEVHGGQTSLPLPKVSGVYLLRLANAQAVKTQKIVISK
jgi:hypothetical protein